jgi:hypothetical protein
LAISQCHQRRNDVGSAALLLSFATGNVTVQAPPAAATTLGVPRRIISPPAVTVGVCATA